ncbi:MAG: hypothetical protein QOH56_3900 [Pseudonocardiales bacterium]|nr:hypothetical protein [Pseudonocardiales bacterium]
MAQAPVAIALRAEDNDYRRVVASGVTKIQLPIPHRLLMSGCWRNPCGVATTSNSTLASKIVTLAEFLLARSAERDQIIRDQGADDPYVEAEIAARRQLLGLWTGQEAHAPVVDGWRERMKDATLADAARFYLAVLAEPYDDHPDYREQWRPKPPEATAGAGTRT